jgi:hypothetical protein
LKPYANAAIKGCSFKTRPTFERASEKKISAFFLPEGSYAEKKAALRQALLRKLLSVPFKDR